MKFSHVMIRVADIDKSLDFYCGLLGLKKVKTMRLEDSVLYFLADNFGDVQIELTLNDETPPEGYKNGNAFGHFAFEVKNLDEFSKKLEEKGYSYLEPPFILSEHSLRISFIQDPDGNEVEIIESPDPILTGEANAKPKSDRP